MTEAEMAQSNAALIKGGYDAFAHGDIQGALAVFTEDILWHVPGRGPLSRDYRGRDEVLGFFQHFMELSHGTFRIQVNDVWLRVTELSCYAPKVRSAEIEAGHHRRSTFGRLRMGEPASSGSTKAISRLKTSFGRCQSSQKA